DGRGEGHRLAEARRVRRRRDGRRGGGRVHDLGDVTAARAEVAVAAVLGGDGQAAAGQLEGAGREGRHAAAERDRAAQDGAAELERHRPGRRPAPAGGGGDRGGEGHRLAVVGRVRVPHHGRGGPAPDHDLEERGRGAPVVVVR